MSLFHSKQNFKAVENEKKLIILGVTEIWSFRLVLEGKKGKEIPESPRIRILRKVSFCLSLIRGVMAGLHMLRTLPIHLKSWEPSFWEVMGSFVLLAYASLAAS